MKYQQLLCTLFLLSTFGCLMCFATDTVILKQGQTITGDILTEKQNKIFLDIGMTVLDIPKDQILEIKYEQDANQIDAQKQNGQTTENNQQTIDAGKLYSTQSRKKITIEKAVEQVAEAVVKVKSPTGIGSGFFINPDGHLITNYHVIEKETKIVITVFQKKTDGFEKKEFKKVKIEAINPFVDLALLKVQDLNDTKVKFAHFGSIDDITVGERVFAIGTPLGLERTVTDGVISTKNRAFEGLIYIQTNADINPGNSGGPLFNLAGQVIGVTNMGYIFFGGLGFAIPIDYVKHFIDNREAFAYDKDNPNTGFRYIQPDKRTNKNKPDFLKNKSGKK